MNSIVNTTSTSLLNSATADLFSLIVILTLLVLLMGKEIISSLDSDWAKRMIRAINVATLPLMIVFLITFVLSIYDVLRAVH